MGKTNYPMGALAAIVISAGTSCSLDLTDNRGEDSPSFHPRGGEPTVEEKRRLAKRLPEVKRAHGSLGAADLDPHTLTPLRTIGGVNVYTTAPFEAVIFEGGMMVDADGSPQAYHPPPDERKGLDNLADAGEPGNWWGIVTDNGKGSGNPVVQGSNDPAPRVLRIDHRARGSELSPDRPEGLRQRLDDPVFRPATPERRPRRTPRRHRRGRQLRERESRLRDRRRYWPTGQSR